VEHADRAPRLVALDAPVGGVGRGRVDAGELERGGGDPRGVVVAVREERGSVPAGGVEVLGGGESAREGLHRPPAPEDPGVRGEAGAVAGDCVEALAPRA
jgi:hypothetical protein